MVPARACAAVAAVLLATNGVWAFDNITVVRLSLALEEEHTLQVDNRVEYILQFVPTEEQSQYPSRVWVRSGGGDAARPLLVTARQRTGAITWQLPYYSGATLLYELERTLCPDDSAAADDDASLSDCGSGAEVRRGEFSLHVSSACGAPFAVSLRVAAVREWRLGATSSELSLTQAAPRVFYYAFAEDEDSVRLVVESEDDVCATIAVQQYTCPITETLDEIEGSTLRMTVQRSGGAQLSKSRYPRGFYVIGVIGDSDAACSGETASEEAWLWEAAVGAGARGADGADGAPVRDKRLTLSTRAALSRAQYAVAASVTLVAFLMFYVAFGALVLAKRWPRWARLVAPRAVLAEPATGAGGPTRSNGALDGSTIRRRRDSAATFDSSDNSDTDTEEDAETNATVTTVAATEPVPPPAPTDSTARDRESVAPDTNESVTAEQLVNDATQANIIESDNRAAGGESVARPFGLPARLHVAALARRHSRVLCARSDRYLYTLYTVAVFYALPVVQFVVAFQMILNMSGSLDLCYYNFLCAHPLGALSDFNHVYSNLGYLLLGALFALQVRRRRLRRRRRPRNEEYGIPQHYGLLSSLGAAMMVVALLSASYHVCPNRLNFQFDTAFMYVLAVLCMVKIYQARHPDINARAHATFGVLAVLIALVVWGVLGGGPLFWSIFTVVHVFTFLLLSLQIYYVGQFRLEKESLAETARALRTGTARPLYTARLVALVIANAVNWAFALYGLVTQAADIASHLLSVLLGNALLYMIFYLCMKLLHGERLRWYAWLYLGGATATWVPALYFFTSGSTDWSATPAQSRERNHECRVLQFYDSHDLWHALSAVALYLTFNAMLTWDDGLSAVKRTEIAVF